MKRHFLLFLVFFLILINCSGYEFTYSKDPTIKEIENYTFVRLTGDDNPLAKNKFKKIVGNAKKEIRFIIDADIKRTSTAAVLEKDATASKTDIKDTVSYSLINQVSNCKILSKQITTISTFSSSSSGYSFSTDLSKEEIIKKNILANIDEFVDFIVSFGGGLSCQKNEN